jgi:hypothetical protein
MKQPIAGLKGIKPRLEKSNGKLSREEAHKLDREYRIHRNQALQLRNHREAMLLAKSRNELIEKKLVMLQAAYLLTAFRSRVLAEPSSLARRLVDGGFVAEQRRTEVQEMIELAPFRSEQYKIFLILLAWLRTKGVVSKTPLHTLRKEFGSQINAAEG